MVSKSVFVEVYLRMSRNIMSQMGMEGEGGRSALVDCLVDYK